MSSLPKLGGQIETDILDYPTLPIITTDPFYSPNLHHACDGLSNAADMVISMFLHVVKAKISFKDLGVGKSFLIDKMILVKL